MSRGSMEAETQGLVWSDEMGRWFEKVKAEKPQKGSLLVNDGNSAVEILEEELRWNGTAIAPAMQIRILRTDAVLWVESWKVKKEY